MTKTLITGGAGFIGSNFVRHMMARGGCELLNFDGLTYAGNLENLTEIEGQPGYEFVKGDITDLAQVQAAFDRFRPAAVVHFAAESHVDRSVLGATEFVTTNVLGTQVLLDVSRAAGVSRFVHVSTDEVYGSLGPTGRFTEQSPLQPNSPYSASKTGSDLLVRAAFHTHGFPALITRCSNNYGPYQFPEKLIPLMIVKALANEPLPVYGKGANVRDWIHVADHCEAIARVLEAGRDGEVYNIGGNEERQNLEVVREILRILGKGEELITYVADRPGHDLRYAIDGGKMERELGWVPQRDFATGLKETVDWYVANRQWWTRVQDRSYREYYERNYAGRG